MNFALNLLYERHEKRRLFLPRAGFEVAPEPSSDQIEIAKSYDHTQDVWRVRRKAQHERSLKAIDEASRLHIPEDGLMEWLQKHHPDSMPVPIMGNSANPSYLIYNSADATTAAPVKQPTGTAIRTMMQLEVATGFTARLIEWGCSFDGSAAATPGQIECVETGTVGATSLTTAYAAADIQPFGDPNATANTAGSSGIPFNLGTSASGFSTASVTEGSTTATRMGDVQMIAPTNQYVKQFPLGREFVFGYWNAAQHFQRVRMTFGTTINTIVYMIVEV